MAEPHVLCLQSKQWIQGILGASPDQGLPAAHPSPGHSEVPEKQAETLRSPGEALVEFFELLEEGGLQTPVFGRPDELGLTWIRKDSDPGVIEIDEFRSVQS